MKTILLLIINIILVGTVFSQKYQNEKMKLVHVPIENRAIMIVFQPDCPLKIEDVDFYIDKAENKPQVKYKIKNTAYVVKRRFGQFRALFQRISGFFSFFFQ